jgi:hypothetical protein
VLRARLSAATEADADTFLGEIDLENTEDTKRANDLVINYRNHPGKIADACRKAARDLGRIRGVSARPKINWFPQFVAVCCSLPSGTGYHQRFKSTGGPASRGGAFSASHPSSRICFISQCAPLKTPHWPSG